MSGLALLEELGRAHVLAVVADERWVARPASSRSQGLGGPMRGRVAAHQDVSRPLSILTSFLS